MKITVWSVPVMDIRFDEDPEPNEFVPTVVELVTPVDVVRGGAKKYIVDFDYTDFGTPIAIGNVANGSLIVNTVLDVTDEFDTGAMTVGTQTAQGLLMTTGESNLLAERTYQRNNFLDVDSSLTLKIFLSGSPSVGAAKLIIFYIE